jgi:hypothetical protein
MRDREYWTEVLRKAEQELAAATRWEVNAAAKPLMRVEAELKWHEQQHLLAGSAV